jgi:8-oxo-dGTP pyrophosphatase MutT (NUDIX family)
VIEPSSFSVSVKGVVLQGDRVLLLKNERDEWELPGGRIELGETPEDCVVREIAEETGWKVTSGPILDSWMYHIAVAVRNVFIVTYGCHPIDPAAPILSDEHQAIRLFEEPDVAELTMPNGYKRSIANWFAQLRSTGSEPLP